MEDGKVAQIKILTANKKANSFELALVFNKRNVYSLSIISYSTGIVPLAELPIALNAAFERSKALEE